MGQIYTELDDSLRDFVERQHVFFVATAPSGSEGHVNCSPKGLDALRIARADHASPISTTRAAAPRPSRTCARTAAS